MWNFTTLGIYVAIFKTFVGDLWKVEDKKEEKNKQYSPSLY